VVAGASGLFFLPELVGTAVPEPFLTMLSRPVMAWDLALLGPGGHANPLFHSALLPVAMILLLFGVSLLRHPVAGFALGSAVYLATCAALGTVDVTYLPWSFLDHAWLWVNAAICALVGLLVLRKSS
jgi:serine protease